MKTTQRYHGWASISRSSGPNPKFPGRVLDFVDDPARKHTGGSSHGGYSGRVIGGYWVCVDVFGSISSSTVLSG